MKTFEAQKGGWIYLFRIEATWYEQVGVHYVKIGMMADDNPKKRLAYIGRFLPFETKLVGLLRTDSPKQIESDIHSSVRDQRIRGEWYLMKDADMPRFFRQWGFQEPDIAIREFEKRIVHEWSAARRRAST